jgi:hypothetical protein
MGDQGGIEMAPRSDEGRTEEVNNGASEVDGQHVHVVQEVLDIRTRTSAPGPGQPLYVPRMESREDITSL